MNEWNIIRTFQNCIMKIKKNCMYHTTKKSVQKQNNWQENIFENLFKNWIHWLMFDVLNLGSGNMNKASFLVFQQPGNSRLIILVYFTKKKIRGSCKIHQWHFLSSLSKKISIFTVMSQRKEKKNINFFPLCHIAITISFFVSTIYYSF